MALSDNDEIYQNSPLSDVACEVRFVGEMQVECERHRFWNAIRDKYSQILVPFAEQGKALALQHYRFRNAAYDSTVSVALNSLAYSERKYRGHTAFITEFLRLVAVFREIYPDIGFVTRVGWRYINLMPFTKENGLLPLNRLLKFHTNLPLNVAEGASSIDFKWVGQHDEGSATIRLANVPRKDLSGQEALLLDIDFGKEESTLSWEDVPALLQRARAAGRETFEKMITDDYREYLRGKTL